MKLEERINVLHQLGEQLQAGTDEFLQASIKRTSMHNAWFTEKNQKQAIQQISQAYLQGELLGDWVADYPGLEAVDPKLVGIALHANRPLAGFHDLLSVFVSGHRVQLKLPEQDPYLMPAILRMLRQIDKRTTDYFTTVERLHGFDAVLATGLPKVASTFRKYFQPYPNLVRQLGNGVAVLSGNESTEALQDLGHDVFQYFGLSERNVGKLYVPEGYDFDLLLKALHNYKEVILHAQYKNKFDYQYALLLLNKADFHANGCILLYESAVLASPIASLHFEYYEKLDELQDTLAEGADGVEVVLGQSDGTVAFGDAHTQSLNTYLDGQDTLAFLRELSLD